MKRNHLLFVLSFMLCGFLSQNTYGVAVVDTANLVIQDSINARSLIISEYGGNWRGTTEWGYIELVNTSDHTLDISRFFVWDPDWGGWNAELIIGPYETTHKVRLFGTLEPNETFVIVQRERNLQEDPYGNPVYPNGYTNSEAEKFADLIGKRWGIVPDTSIQEMYICTQAMGLAYVNQVTKFNGSTYPDSVFVDRFGTKGNQAENPIAGITSSATWRARIYVRKYSVKTGNTLPGEENDYPDIEWDNSRGTDISDSEWLPLPRSMDHGYDKIFTTIGYHGDNPEFSLKSDIATIDTANRLITLPYGITRDSVFRIFETGINHGWNLKLGADTAQYYLQSDDSLFFYTVGTSLKTFGFGIKIEKDEDKIALIAPKVYKNNSGVFIRQFDMSNEEDTIGTLPFDMPVDTFFAYAVKANGASWKIIPKDGVNRPEIKVGDILEVTSKDGSVKKEYYLGVQPFFPNHNANLRTIYFPGLLNWENPNTYTLTDTLLGFLPNNRLYNIILDEDITVSPAIVAQAENSRSTIKIERAKDLKGSEAERTATIIVTAEDDTSIVEYKLIFNVERETPKVKGSLFITDFATGWGATNQNYNIQLYNPTGDLIDMSDYAFISYRANNWARTISRFTTDSNWVQNNESVLRFGSIIENALDGTPVFKSDLVQTKILLESQETYSMATRGGYPLNGGDASVANVDKLVDLVFGDDAPSTKGGWPRNEWITYANEKYGSADPWGSGYMPLAHMRGSSSLRNSTKSWGTPFFGIAKILSDSVKDGIKHVMADFENDYEWVDVFGGPSRTAVGPVLLYDNDTVINCSEGYTSLDMGVYRKSSVYKGNPVDNLSFGTSVADTILTTVTPSEWIFYGVDANGETDYSNTQGTGLRDIRDGRIKSHTMITYSHIPYLTSSTYLLGEGLEGVQDVLGVTSGTSVQQFLDNVDKADTGMVVKVFNSSDVELDPEDEILIGTSIWSKSANGSDSVNYVISTLGELDNSCTLTSSTYTVSTTLPTGIISGIKMGTSLADILKKVSAPGTAIVMATDGKMQNLPLYKYNNDSNTVKKLEPGNVLASERTFIEVMAQNKTDKCIYELQFDEEETPFILSDVYVIDPVEKVINYVYKTSPATLLANIIASPGATIKVVNKYDQERTLGTISFSDRVILTKGDVSISYWLKFTSEEEIIGVGVKEMKEVGMSVYPNPTTDFVTLSNVNSDYLEIRDLTGKLIVKQKVTNANPVLDMRKMSTGIYIISTDNATYKVVKN